MNELLIFGGGTLFGMAIERACAIYRGMRTAWNPPNVENRVARERAAREQLEAQFQRFNIEAAKRETWPLGYAGATDDIEASKRS